MLTMNLNGNTENFSNPYITAMAQQSQIASSSNAEKSDAFDIYEDEIFETDLEIATPATASVASAVSLPQHSALSLLNTVNINVTDTVDLQDTIDGAGTTPTLIVLSSDVSRSSNSGAMGHHVLKIGSGQEIYLESAEGEHISIDVTFSGDTTRGAIYVQEGGTLYLNNITVTGGDRTNSYGGGGGILLGIGSGSTGNAVLHMGDGAVVSGNTSGYGGGVYVSPGCELHMSAGSVIKDNSTLKSGGGVYIYPGGEFYMAGGEISYNTTNEGGGDGVYVDGNAQTGSYFNMSGGLITYNGIQSKHNGAGVVLVSSVFDMDGGEISHHYGNGSGGGVRVQDSLFNMNDGEISYNDNYYGGAVTIVGSARESITGNDECSIFRMKGGRIHHNTGSYPGVMVGDAGWSHQGGTFNMSGGTISYNKSNDDFKHGGGLYVTNYGSANISGDAEISNNILNNNGVGGGIGIYYGYVTIEGNVKISKNTAGVGGGIYIAGTSELTIRGGEISDNFSYVKGGGISMGVSSNVTLDGAELSGNSTSKDGGGIYTSAGSKLILKNAVIKDNVATVDGGGIYMMDYGNLYIPAASDIKFWGNEAENMKIADNIPNLGDWSGTISKTTIDGIVLTGVINNTIEDYIANGGDIRKWIVFNNLDINMISSNHYYLVSFNSNGGSDVQPQAVADDGTGKAKKPKDPTRSGFEFAGWYTGVDLTQEYDFDIPVTSNITIYAKWTSIGGGETGGGETGGGETGGGGTGGGETGGGGTGSGGTGGGESGGSGTGGGGTGSGGTSDSGTSTSGPEYITIYDDDVSKDSLLLSTQEMAGNSSEAELRGLPKTGDSSNMEFYVLVSLFLSALALLMLKKENW